MDIFTWRQKYWYGNQKRLMLIKWMCKSSLIDNVDKNIQRAQRIRKKQKHEKDSAKTN